MTQTKPKTSNAGFARTRRPHGEALPRSKHVYALDLPNWMNEHVETEAKYLGINVNQYMSEIVETHFEAQQRDI